MQQTRAHSGELLREDVLTALEMGVTDAASRLRISQSSLTRVPNGRTGINAGLAVRLERAGVSSARFWMRLQSNYDLARAMQGALPEVRLIQAK